MANSYPAHGFWLHKIDDGRITERIWCGPERPVAADGDPTAAAAPALPTGLLGPFPALRCPWVPRANLAAHPDDSGRSS
jgi:hypothetical protein